MRLWHYKLLPLLNDKLLISQWRECCAVSSMYSINKKFFLVNRIYDYPPIHIKVYSDLVAQEMKNRGFKISQSSYDKLCKNLCLEDKDYSYEKDSEGNVYINQNNINSQLFYNWHTNRYLLQNYYNIQEKVDCGLFSKDDFKKIDTYMEEIKLR